MVFFNRINIVKLFAYATTKYYTEHTKVIANITEMPDEENKHNTTWLHKYYYKVHILLNEEK